VIETAVSTAAGGACAGGAVLLYCAEKLPGLNKVTNRLHTDRAQALLILTATSSMIGTPAGRWWNQLINDANTWLSDLIGAWTGLVVTGVFGMLALLYFINDLVTRRVEHRTRILAAVLPVLASTIPGPVGESVVAILSWTTTTLAQLVGGAFGVTS
jgi:hypothetical protein